jgi:hypothetical protein
MQEDVKSILISCSKHNLRKHSGKENKNSIIVSLLAPLYEHFIKERSIISFARKSISLIVHTSHEYVTLRIGRRGKNKPET